jgi:hypothetical protein
MYVAIKKFKQDDDDEYVSKFKFELIELLGVGEEDSTERNQDSEAIEA